MYQIYMPNCCENDGIKKNVKQKSGQSSGQ